MVTSFAYHFTPLMYQEKPGLAGRASKGHDYDLQSNIFATLPEVFLDRVENKKEYIRILGRDGSQRCWKYIYRKYVTHVDNLDKYKLFISKAFGTGQFGEALPEEILGTPGDGATITFLSIGFFDTEKEAILCSKYLKTRFARTLLGVLKATQNGSKSCWRMIPLQDFTADSDIDWSAPVAAIDKQLYKKYGLSQEEIDFIETHVKEME
jgi:type II restriction enzyme